MDTANKEYLKNNLFSISTFILVIGFVIQQSRWQENIEVRLNILEAHVADTRAHPPIEQLIKLFVPRQEMSGVLTTIDKSLDEIKDDLKKSLKF